MSYPSGTPGAVTVLIGQKKIQHTRLHPRYCVSRSITFAQPEKEITIF